jgi:hypothetical protein
MAMAPPLTLIAVVRHVQLLHVAQHHRGEGLVEFEQVDVGGAHAGALQGLARWPAPGRSA